VEFGEDRGRLDGVDDVRLAGGAFLVAVRGSRAGVGAFDDLHGVRGKIPSDDTQQVLKSRLWIDDTRPGDWSGDGVIRAHWPGRWFDRLDYGDDRAIFTLRIVTQRGALPISTEVYLTALRRGNGSGSSPHADGIMGPSLAARSDEMTYGERIVTVTTLVTAGVALSLVVQPPYVWLLVALLVITVAVGTDQVLRSHPRLRRGEAGVAVLVIPALITLGGALFLRLPAVGRGSTVVAGLVAFGLLLGIALLAEYQTYDQAGRHYREARLVLNLVAYLIAFILFSAVFAPKFRSILSATAILLISALITAELFRGAGKPSSHVTWVLVVALALGQVTWALNYWVLGAFAGGAILLLVFYTLTGIVRSYLNATLVPRVLSEHLIVAGAGLTAVIAGGLWLR
jgi:uncharacterized protein DUF5656